MYRNKHQWIVLLAALLLTPLAQAQLFSFNSPLGGATNAKLTLQMLQQRADLAYASGQDKRAWKLYQQLADVGDKFAQFRIASMYEDGRHVQRDLVQAHSWAALAAETGRKEFRQYQTQLRTQLNASQLADSEQLTQDLIAEYGIFNQAVTALDVLRDGVTKCTGSRVGSRCDRVESAMLGCSISSDYPPDGHCLRIGSLGLADIRGSFPANLRSIEKALHVFVNEYNPGRVELGDFEWFEQAMQH
ncbi:MAG: hypothetical protein KKC01_07515 [Gammaproteobacteria bacterium]|nr:hypothetical protein [Gammaproteobacteria bacterium]